MVASKASNGRWVKKYKVCFIFGLILLLLQIVLVSRFLELNNAEKGNEWQPQSQTPAVAQRAAPIATNATVLRLDELDFRPECAIVNKEAVSAINRAKTQACKQLLANVTCLSLGGRLYPHRLEGGCPAAGFTRGKSLGCFKDEKKLRLLTGYYGVNNRLNSVEFCIELCLQSGFQYAGVQYANECFCGNDEAPASKLPDSSCNMRCPGDAHATCGGYFTMNIFETGIKKFQAQVASTDQPASDESVRIVFLLTINGRALRQVKRLIRILYHQKHYYYIHVDVREDYLFRELLPLERRFPNIRLSRKRFATIWGGASLLTMLLSCMADLLRVDWRWDFVLNLSESDYPVKRLGALERFLAANRDRNFVKSHGRDPQRFLQKQGLDKTFVECERRMWRVSNRALPKGIQMDGGSDWVALSRSFVEFVAKPEPDELILGLKKVFSYTLLPAESFFHTVLRNSPFCATYIDNNLHVTNWKRKLGCKCQYKHIVDWCGCSPNDFRPDDWQRIQATETRQLYFARKFEPIISQAVLLKLELWLFGLDTPPRAVRNLHAYWQSLYHRSDLTPRLSDAHATMFGAIGRLAQRRFDCATKIGTIIDATSYNYRDEHKLTLVRFAVANGAIEVGFRPKDAFELVGPAEIMKRIESVLVSSEYDQKEQISRNFARILSAYSEPTLIYRFGGAANAPVLNLTALWIDPAGGLVEVGEISIDDGFTNGFLKLGVKGPLSTGVWQVKLVAKDLVFVRVEFLILPLEGAQNGEKVGLELQNSIDELVGGFYNIKRYCYSGRSENVCSKVDKRCEEQNWSSLASDPKSAIDFVNKSSGMFDVW